MNILFYSPFNSRSRDTESLMIAFKRQEHRVISLSQAEGNLIHDYLRSQGVETFTHNVHSSSTLLYFFRHIVFLVKFCSKQKIDVIYSHLEPANFVAVLAQFFIRARVYIGRHHIDEAALQGFNRSLAYKATYSLARKIIVVSNKAASYMVEVEKINRSKIIKINLAYDFSLYAKPDLEIVEKIKKSTFSELTLITACRFTKYKRADLSIHVLKKLVDAGVNARLILLGKGEEEINLRQLGEHLGVMSRILMPGHVNNVIDYLAASDILVHPSLLESSCVIVKEAAVTNVPVIVCRDVGDFNEYIVHEVNGFLVDADNFVNQAVDVILGCYQDKIVISKMTDNLRHEVLQRFDIKNILAEYDILNGRVG